MSWLSGWPYRKSITLSRASGAVTNYQMKLLVGESSGATGENVDCNGLCLSTFNDLRFTKADGTTLLDYWIESISGTAPNQLATIWIEFDSIGTGATTFYMYYGKADASAVSSGANTFLFFDDFERGNDGDTVDGVFAEINPHVHISTEEFFSGSKSMKILGGNATYAQAQIAFSASNDIAIQFRLKKNDNAETFPLYHGNGTKRAHLMIDASNNLKYIYGSNSIESIGILTPNEWQSIECNNFNWSAYTYDIFLNDAKIKTGAAMQTSTLASNVYWFVGSNILDKNTWIDNFIVRNYSAIEPAWGMWSVGEYLGPSCYLTARRDRMNMRPVSTQNSLE